MELSAKGKQSWLLKCAGISTFAGERIAGSRSGEPCMIKARGILAEAATDATGKITKAKEWITSSNDIYERLIAEGKDQDEFFLNKLRDYYRTHQMPGFCTTRPKCVFQGDGFSVIFDNFGHPRFEVHVPEMKGVGKIAYNPDNIGAGNLPIGNNSTLLGGKGNDIADANRWIKKQFPNNSRTGFRPNGTKVPEGRIDILDKDNNWIECTWHHHEDGRNLIPVPSNIHNRIDGGAGHTGGNSIIDKGLKDFFNSLIF